MRTRVAAVDGDAATAGGSRRGGGGKGDVVFLVNGGAEAAVEDRGQGACISGYGGAGGQQCGAEDGGKAGGVCDHCCTGCSALLMEPACVAKVGRKPATDEHQCFRKLQADGPGTRVPR